MSGFRKYPVGTFLVTGRPGMGKTTLMRQMVKEMLADGRQYALIHDPAGQYEGHHWNSVEEFKQAEKIPRVNVFLRSEPGPVVRAAHDLAWRGIKLLVVVDEIDLICRSGRWLDEIKPSKYSPLRETVHRGRHFGRPANNKSPEWGLTLLGSCRRPANIHTDVGELAKRIYLFRSNGRNDIGWIEQTCGPEIAEKVSKLPPYKHVVYDPADTSDIET